MNKTRFHLVSYNASNIIVLDYSQIILENELALLTQQGFQFAMKEEKENRSLRILVDLTGSVALGKGREELKKTFQELKPFVKRKAIVGASNKNYKLINFINFLRKSPTRMFIKNEDALSYLGS